MRNIFIFLVLALAVSACGEKTLTANEVAEQFWLSAQQGKLDKAKQLVTWDTASYLKYFKDDDYKIKRVEFGPSESQESMVKIETVLILERKQASDVRLPTQTVLVKTEDVWRVQLKQTLAAVVNKSMNAAADQLNQLLREGMQELNKALAGSVDEISSSLEQGAKELGKSLEENAKQFGDTLNQLQQELNKSTPESEPGSSRPRTEI